MGAPNKDTATKEKAESSQPVPEANEESSQPVPEANEESSQPVPEANEESSQPVPEANEESSQPPTEAHNENPQVSTDAKPHIKKKIFPSEEDLLYDGRYEVIQTFGNGAFGEVKVLIDRKDKKKGPIAVKYIPLKKAVVVNLRNGKKACKEALMMERIVKPYVCRNVVNYSGSSYDPERKRFAIFMEFLEAGALYNHIVPDKGVPSTARAQYFFTQLMNAVRHIHSLGIAHLDIKAENCFLKQDGTLKLGDYGMSECFRFKDGQERRLHAQNGSAEYKSPQILAGDYRGDSADIWACGILLLLMLSGDYPWHKASNEDANYLAWREKTVSLLTEAPWKRLEVQPLALVKAMLTHDEENRIGLEEIAANSWVQSDNLPLTAQQEPKKIQKIASSQQPNTYFLKSFKTVPPPSSETATMGTSTEEKDSYSSPPSKKARVSEAENSSCNRSSLGNASNGSSTAKKPSLPQKSFSQPANFGIRKSELLEVEKPLVKGYELSWLSCRMTRFCATISPEMCRSALKDIFDQNEMQSVVKPNGEIVVQTKSDIVFVVNIYDLKPNMDLPSRVMVDVRRSRGDGLTFNRIYFALLPYFKDFWCEDGTDWLEERGLKTAVKP